MRSMTDIARIKASEAKWEKAYHLPVGTLEAIRHNPSPARMAEVIASVRDLATGERQLLNGEGYHE